MLSHGHLGPAPRTAGDAGFTLVELVVAVSILFIVVMGVMSAVSFSALSTQQAAARSRALNVANEVLERARNLPFDDVGIRYADGSYGDPAGTIPASTTVGVYSVRTEVSWARDRVTHRRTYKNIKIMVSWASPVPGSVSIASATYGKSDITNVGDLMVTARESGTGIPIPSAQVYVMPAGGTAQRVVWTDAQGESFFGALPIGPTPVLVTAAGWKFDDSELTTCAVIPDLLTSVVAWGYRPCVAAITVVDTVGTPIPSASVTITDSNGRPQTLLTGDDGLATFTDLLPDLWSVDVSAAGRAPAEGNTIEATDGGQTYSLTIIMTKVVPPGSLRVRVKTIAGAAISGATVAVTSSQGAPIAGSPQTSPTSGEVFFTAVPTGKYRITVTRTGYQTTQVNNVQLESGVECSVSVGMPTAASSTGSIRVRVARSNGDPRSGWIVRVRGTGVDVSRTTDSSGYATFDDLPVGSYQVSTTGRSGRRYISDSHTSMVTERQTDETTLVPN